MQANHVSKKKMLKAMITAEGSVTSLVPRPRPAFHRLQYGKAGEGLVSFLT